MPTSDNIYADNSVFQYNLSEEEQQEIKDMEEMEAAEAAKLSAPSEAPVEPAAQPTTQTPSPATSATPQAPTAPAEEEGAMAQPEEVEQQVEQEGTTPFGNNQMLEENLPENTKGALNMAMGVGDIVADTVGLLPWLKPADEWWEEVSGRNDPNYDPVQKMIRDTSSNLIPFLTAAGPLTGALGKVGTAAKIGSGVDKTAKGAALLGLSTGISAINDTTKEPGNLGTVLGDVMGVDVPWATRDGDSPDWIFGMNMLENAVLDGAGELATMIAGVKATKGGNNIIPANEASAAKIKPKPKQTPAEAMDAHAQLTEAATNEEAIRRYEADPEGTKGYDAFVNEPAEPQARAVQFKGADPVNFIADNDRILNNINTTNGRQRPAFSDHFMNRFLAANESADIEDIVEEATKDMDVQFSNTIGDTVRSVEEIDASIDRLTASVFLDDVTDFATKIEDMKYAGEEILGNAVKRLPEDKMLELSNAMTKALEIMQPAKRRTRAVLSTQAGGGLVDVSRAIELIGDTADTARQQQMAVKNLGVLLKAVGEQKYIDGYSLNMSKLMKNKPDSMTAEWFTEQGEKFKIDIKNQGQKTLEFISTMEEISKTNPEYFKPLYKQFVKTGGKVDDLYKLGKLIDNRMGFWKKAFIDGDKEVPSILVKELDSVRYNNLLNAKAPLSAGLGATMGITGKPLTILTGYLSQGKFKDFGDSLKTFGNINETFSRALKYASSEWKYAVENPDFSAARGRADFQLSNMEDFDMLEELSETWYREKNFGKIAAWNILKITSQFNRQAWNRWGINSMTAIDGFVKSTNASLIARERAMRDVYAKGNWNEAAYQAKQTELYNKSFDKNGVLTDEAAKYASGEMNLNLDTNLTSGIDGLVKQVPVAKALFLFPRTGVNQQVLNFTFSPTGALGIAIGKSRKAQRAKLNSPEAAEVLMEHGFAPDDMQALERLKAEYKGRQLMGASLTFGAGMLAMNSGLTGSGPANDAMKRDMRKKGWKPYQITIGGQQFDYSNMGPITLYLGLVADTVFESTRADQAFTEDMFRTLGHSISMNITNQTFLSGFEPLAAAISQDPSAWSRLAANMVDSYIPGTGIRSVLSKALVPQLKDVEQHFLAQLANRNRWIPWVNEKLVDAKDIYTGESINYADPMTSVTNALLPAGRSNGGMEPWRQKFIESGWTGMKQHRINPDTGEKFTPDQRQAIDLWIAENSNLGADVKEIFEADDQWWKKNLTGFVKARGLKPKNIMDVKDTYLYDLLDKLHDGAYADAYQALKAQDQEIGEQARLKNATAAANARGDYDSAKQLAEQFLQNSFK